MTQRLVCVCPALGVPSEVWLHRQLESLRPHLIAVITWQQDNPNLFSLPGVEVIVAPEALRHQLTGVRRLLASIRHPNVGPPRFAKPTENWLREQIIKLQPDAVLGHYGHFATLVARVCHDLPVRMYAHFNGHDLSSYLVHKPSYRRELTSKIARFDGMIVVAKYMADWLRKHGATSEQLLQLPYGIPIDQCQTTPRSNSETCTFLAVGRLVAKKAPDLTIKAFARCHRAVPATRLVIVGDGHLANRCRRLVRRLGLESAVEFRGLQSPAEVRIAMQEADVFVQHSITARNGDKEGWPVSVAEAMAARLPIISTRHAGITDQVEEAVTGFLGDEKDVASMAASMVLLATNASMRRQMGENAHRFIRQFDCRHQANELLRFTGLTLPAERTDGGNAIATANRL
jgi:colanic acid/amylovoran biosynthesis glycosyltransferase